MGVETGLGGVIEVRLMLETNYVGFFSSTLSAIW